MKFNPWDAIFGSDGLLSKVNDKGKDLLGDFLEGFKNNIFNTDTIVDLGTAFLIGEMFPKPDQGEKISDLKDQMNEFLPEFVKSRIAAGQMENMAAEDLRSLTDYGIVVKRGPNGQKISETPSAFGGRIGQEIKEAYGYIPKYKTQTVTNPDGSKTTTMVVNAQGQPVLEDAGKPGFQEIEQQFLREQKRLSDHYLTGTRVENVDRAGVPLAEGINRMQDVLQEEVRPTQAQAGDSFRSLLAAQDPNRLSGSEMANVERGLGRMGMGLGRAAEMDKYKAAAVFGDALAQKQQRLGQALGQTGNVMASLRSGGGINPGVAYGEGTMPTPTSMAGQLPTFGNTANTALGAVQPIVTGYDAQTGGKQVVGDVLREQMTKGN